MTRNVSLFLIVAVAIGCTNSNHKGVNDELATLRAELDSLKTLNTVSLNKKEDQIATFLTFQNNDAEEAMNFYISLFENSKIISVQRYGNEGPAKEGTIMYATFELNGSKFACSDSYIKHDWNFTPGVSNFVECTSNEQIEYLFTKLSENGQVMFPIDNYGWSEKFAFVEDRFGVSWQLNLN